MNKLDMYFEEMKDKLDEKTFRLWLCAMYGYMAGYISNITSEEHYEKLVDSIRDFSQFYLK